MERISEEKIAEAIKNSLTEELSDIKDMADYDWMVADQDVAIAQAQLEADKAEHERVVREIFDWFEAHFDIGTKCDCDRCIEYQAFKSKYEGK